MAERYPVPNMGISVPTMATPTLTLSPNLDLLQDLEMSNEQEFFLMDGTDFMLDEGNIDTLSPLSAEVDQAQPCRCMCAQLATVEAGSAYRSLAGQLTGSAVETTRSLAIQSPRWKDSLVTVEPVLGAQLPASMPQTIARPMDTPSIAVSQWPQHVSHSAAEYPFDMAYHSSYPIFNDHLMEAPSNSFQSTNFSEALWSEVQEFQCLGWPEGDFQSSLTAPSSFEMPTYHLSTPGSLSLPLVPNALVQSQDELDRIRDAQHVEPLFEKRSLPPIPLPDTNASTLSIWAKGTYNVSDRTSFGKLARPSAPSPVLKKRRAAPSHAGSSASLSCQDCGKTFNSKSEKDHHARWHGPRTQVCAVCGKGFIASKDLRRHERIHRPTEHAFFCDHPRCVYGTRGFARKDHLLRHQKTHGVALGSLDAAAGCSASF